VRFVQNGAVSYTVHKKKREAQNGVVLMALWVFFFPWTREAGEEEDFSSPCFHRLSSFKKHQKDADQGHPLA
jgi:hypothetical protein